MKVFVLQPCCFRNSDGYHLRRHWQMTYSVIQVWGCFSGTSHLPVKAAEHKPGTGNSLWQWLMSLWRHRVHKDRVWRWFSGSDLDYDFRDKNTWQTGVRKRTEGESGISSSPEFTCEGGRFYFNQAELIIDRQSKTVFCKLNLVMPFHDELTRQLSSSEFVYEINLNSEGVLLYFDFASFHF